ncbi:MAG: TonB-dependent receptor [Bryobacteraceae bacterium]|nr:TonB-dependent receptor [Bryobacteraceae bacterium]
MSWNPLSALSCLILVALTPLLSGDHHPGFSGLVTDSSGAAIADVKLELKNSAGAVLGISRTNAEGHFVWHGIPSGIYHLRVAAPGFAARELAVNTAVTRETTITLEPESVYTHVAVSSTRGAVDETAFAPYVAIVKDSEALQSRPLPTIGNVLEHEPGILVQQSTYAQVSPFLRGFTGYHVLNLVDGIRFNNSTFRSGPNQYLAFVEPSQAQRLEALLGPAGAQYGSDSLGGTINVVTLEPRFSERGALATHGEVAVAGATADLSASAAARLAFGTERVSWLFGASGRRYNDVRAGSGGDSRNVFYRLFGLPRETVNDLLGGRQQDTGFDQYGLHTKFAARPRPDQLVSLWYQRGVQDGVHSYKDLLGGLGRLQSTFEPQALNFFYARYEKLSLGALDSLSGTFSINSQTDGGLRQNLRLTDAITRDYNRVDAYGYSSQATTHFGNRAFVAFGGDVYDERIRSDRDITNPVRTTVENVRPLYPDGSTYRTYGLFGQSNVEVLPSRLRIGIGGRLTGIRFRTREESRFGVPESSQWFRDVTFNTSVSWQLTSIFGLQGLVSRGFRAPNLNDLGAIGLNDLGYEIPAAEAIPAGALLSSDAGEGALPKGGPIGELRPESLMNYEFGLRFTARRLYTRVQLFDAELYDPIVRRTLLFPVNGIPTQLAGNPVTLLPQTAAQSELGVATVATGFDPRAVKAFVNDGRARYYGFEWLASYALSSRWSLDGGYSYILGRELNPNRFARRLPPQSGSLSVRYVPSGRRFWMEASFAASGAQERLSGGDRDDERIGASRRRQDIADFFRGARVASYLDATGQVFLPTGETLRQIQDRVLPLGATINRVRVAGDNTRVPLYLSTAGWATLGFHAGMPFGERWRVVAGLQNLTDKGYRVHGSGLDSPGINGYVSLRYTF